MPKVGLVIVIAFLSCQKDTVARYEISVPEGIECPQGTKPSKTHIYLAGSADMFARGRIPLTGAKWVRRRLDMDYCSTSDHNLAITLPEVLDKLHPAITIPAIINGFGVMLPEISGPVSVRSNASLDLVGLYALEGLSISFVMDNGQLSGPLHIKNGDGVELFAETKNGNAHGKARFVSDEISWRGQFSNGKLISSTINNKPEVISSKGRPAEDFDVTGVFKKGYPVGQWKKHGVTFDFDADNVTESHYQGARRYKQGLRHDLPQWQSGYRKKVEHHWLASQHCNYKSGFFHGSCVSTFPHGLLVIVKGNYSLGVPDGDFVFEDQCSNELHRLTIHDGTGPFRTYDAPEIWAEHFDLFHTYPGFRDPSLFLDADYCEGELKGGVWRSLTCRKFSGHETMSVSYNDRGEIRDVLGMHVTVDPAGDFLLLKDAKFSQKASRVESKQFLVSKREAYDHVFHSGLWVGNVKSEPKPCRKPHALEERMMGKRGSLEDNHVGSCEQQGNVVECKNLPSPQGKMDATFTPCKPAHIKTDKVWCQN